MLLNQFLLLAAVLFCIGVYGVLVRKNGMLVLMSIELILNAVNINLVAFGTLTDDVLAPSSPSSRSRWPPPKSASVSPSSCSCTATAAASTSPRPIC